MKLLLTAAEAAEALAVSPKTVRRQLPQNGMEPIEVKTDDSNRDVSIGALAGDLKRLQGKPTDRLMPWHSYDWVRRLLKQAAKDAGITARRFGWHTLRHMHGTWMRELGADLMDVRDGMGHANLETTAGYVQANDRRRWEAAQLRLQEMVVSGGVN